jgi:hypothetical protein
MTEYSEVLCSLRVLGHAFLCTAEPLILICSCRIRHSPPAAPHAMRASLQARKNGRFLAQCLGPPSYGLGLHDFAVGPSPQDHSEHTVIVGAGENAVVTPRITASALSWRELRARAGRQDRCSPCVDDLARVNPCIPLLRFSISLLAVPGVNRRVSPKVNPQRPGDRRPRRPQPSRGLHPLQGRCGGCSSP